VHEQEILAGAVLQLQGAVWAEGRARRPPRALVDLLRHVGDSVEGVPLAADGVPDRVLQAVTARGKHLDRLRDERDPGDPLRREEVTPHGDQAGCDAGGLRSVRLGTHYGADERRALGDGL
jgi:hypothetical protein